MVMKVGRMLGFFLSVVLEIEEMEYLGSSAEGLLT